MNSSQKNSCFKVRTAWYLAANIVGACIFLLLASRSWVGPELANTPGASGGDAFVWFFTAVPILLLFVLFNIAVFVWAGIARHRQHQWPLSWLSWLSVAIWLSAVFVDNAHHGA